MDIIGYAAAFFTTFCNVPQIIKILRERKVEGISLKTQLFLATGLALWIVYGMQIKSLPIILANSVALCLVSVVLFFLLKKRVFKQRL